MPKKCLSGFPVLLCNESQRGPRQDIQRGKRWHPATWEGRPRSLPAQVGECTFFLWAVCVSGPWATGVQRSECCDLLAAVQGARAVRERGRDSRMASRFPRQPETLPARAASGGGSSQGPAPLGWGEGSGRERVPRARFP